MLSFFFSIVAKQLAMRPSKWPSLFLCELCLINNYLDEAYNMYNRAHCLIQYRLSIGHVQWPLIAHQDIFCELLLHSHL